MFFLFYRIYLETVLAQDTISKEDITSIESIRQKYRIPLADHISILSEIEDGVKIYTSKLGQFGILNVQSFSPPHSQEREIKMLYYNDTRDSDTINVLRTTSNSHFPVANSSNTQDNTLSAVVISQAPSHA